MTCKQKNKGKNCVRRTKKPVNENLSGYEFILSGKLEEKGRLQFFYHSPSSRLPVRDVLNEQKKGHKTEPHIEIGAENYLTCCYQDNNIIPFLKSNEKYLFLFTTCRNEQLMNHYKKRYIVGYIVKEDYIDCNGHYAVKGDTWLFSFDDAFPLERVVDKYEHVRVKKLPVSDTIKILTHFKDRKNLLEDCVKEIVGLDDKNPITNKTCKVLSEESCQFQQNGCLRWSIT